MTDNDPSTFQNRANLWFQECFGPEISADTAERGCRFLEEALELVQSTHMSKAGALALVDYVYSRPEGDPPQEAGQVMVTLAALCLAHNMNMHQQGELELDRIFRPEVMEAIRAKQASKPKGPLPQ